MANEDVTLTSAMRTNLLLLQRTDRLIGDTQNKLATGKKINTALDGPTEFFAAKNLNTRAGDLSKLKDSMGQAISTIQAADTGISAIEDLMDQMRGLTTTALGNLGNDAASIATRKNLAEQFNELKAQIDKLAEDSGYQGKNLLSGNGLRIDSTSTSRTEVNTITGLSNARTTNVTAVDTYSIRVSGDGAVDGDATDITDAEFDRGLVGLKISGTMSSTLGSFSDITIETKGSLGRERTFTIKDGNEARNIQFFDNTQAAEAELTQAADSNTAQVSTVNISGTIEAGDTFSVTIEGITFEVEAALDTSANADPGATTDDATTIASKLAASINQAITDNRLSSSIFAGSAASWTSGEDSFTVTGQTLSSADAPNDFSISATAENAASLQISESFASGAVVSFTVDRAAMEAAGNGSSVIEKDVNIQISVTNLDGETITRDGLNQRGQAKLSDGENAFAFESGTVRLTVDENEIQQAASAQAAENLTTTQVADANTENDLTVQFNEKFTNSITIESQNVSTGGQGLRIDYAQNNFLDRSDIEAAVDQLDYAKSTLRNASQMLSTNLNIVTTRADFTDEFTNVLEEGANKLTLADQNEEGTKLLMLQTRQQLGSISLSIANQQQQAILQLF